WRDGDHGEPGALASAYRTAFALAAGLGCVTVAAPSISTGIYGFPIERAAPIALAEARTALRAEASSIREITFALYSSGDLAVFTAALG
ncbi:MAG: macro domain-containing protein, partial [Candidatus Dormiibacterota bacterium]